MSDQKTEETSIDFIRSFDNRLSRLGAALVKPRNSGPVYTKVYSLNRVRFRLWFDERRSVGTVKLSYNHDTSL